MPDIPAVPTVDLLTRAANAAGKAAAEAECDETTSWRHFASVIGKVFQRHPSAHLIAASGPDHWRAVEALLRAAIEAHGPDHAGRCVSAGGRPLGGQGLLAAIDRSGVCMWVQSLRPLAEQVLQHLGDSE